MHLDVASVFSHVYLTLLFQAPECNSNELQIMAIADFTSTSDNVLSFKKGTIATLVVQSDSDWWCIKLADNHGWVPSEYWLMLNVRLMYFVKLFSYFICNKQQLCELQKKI